MESYPTYDALALDLDLHFFDKISVLKHIGNKCVDDNGGWFVVTDDGHCHLFDKDGNLDDIRKLVGLRESHLKKGIKKIIIPDSITRITMYTFYWQNMMTDVTIPNSVEIIGDHAFYNCCRLKNIVIPNSVIKIGYNAFYGCDDFTKITIPSSVMEIGEYAFHGCTNLKKLFFKGKTLRQVRAMYGYPWGIKDKSIIKAELK